MRTDSVLRNSRLLQRISGAELDDVVRAAVCRDYPANKVIVEQNTPADRLFLLVQGSARYFFITPDGKKAYLLWLTPGDAFGAASLLADQTDFLLSTEAASDTRVLVWRRETIRTLARQNTTLLDNGLSIAYEYLVWYLATHLSLICDTARQRLAHVLLSLARGIGRKRPDGIRLDITNEQLASTANLTHFTVCRLLSEWHKNGTISKSRGKIVLIRPEQLFGRPRVSSLRQRP
ncbi:MAG TPA: Crp/Fnr family transcriptional regulator [Dongiaceae bacterium]|nr:Crp/Fnr family transcriptional regulator [Dongiaceae bacterium]